MWQRRLTQGVQPAPPRPALPRAASRWWRLAGRLHPRLPIYLADFREDPKWLLMFTLARLIPVRRALWAIGHSHSMASTQDSLISCRLAPDEVGGQLHREGLSMGLSLPAEIAERIRTFAEQTPCFGNFDRSVPFLPHHHRDAERSLGRPILVGHYLERIEQSPDIERVRSDPLLRDIANQYLHAKPILISTRLWWSFPAIGYDETALKLASQNRFHFDMNDWRSVKFYFYLTDVDSGTGPHVYVLGSHRRKRIRDQLTLFVGKSASEIERYYGTGKIVSIQGRAGDGFAEDPFGFHMGTVAHRGPRLVLEVEYGVSQPTARRYYGDLTPRT